MEEKLRKYLTKETSLPIYEGSWGEFCINEFMDSIYPSLLEWMKQGNHVDNYNISDELLHMFTYTQENRELYCKYARDFNFNESLSYCGISLGVEHMDEAIRRSNYEAFFKHFSIDNLLKRALENGLHYCMTVDILPLAKTYIEMKQ